MEQKYAATYHSKTGKAVIHIVAPPPMTEEQRQAILSDYYRAGWAIWNSLSVEEQLRINAEYESQAD